MDGCAASADRSVMLLGLISMAVFIGGFGAWSVFAPLAEAAIAQGVIKVEGQHRVIANQEGGSVRELLGARWRSRSGRSGADATE